MDDLTAKIKKAKKKLKKLQKRQRKQDKQGVSNTADQWASDTLDKFLAGKNEPYEINKIKHANITEEMMDAIRERYEINKIKPSNEIIKCHHLLVGSKVLENGDIIKKCLGCGIDMRSITIDNALNAIDTKPYEKKPLANGDRVEVKLGGCDEWFKGTVIRARKQEVELDPHEYTYPKIADETNITDIRIV